MIRDIPNSADFRNFGLRYLNLGWGMALEVLLHYSDAKDWGFDFEPDLEQGFWESADPEFATALTLIEQGVEFLIKARIAEISPWLLISRNPDSWPRRCDKEDVVFSLFRTLDAQDLLKVHDTISSNRLPEEFAIAFDDLRRKRNTMMHTVDLKLRASAVEIITNVLLSVDHLIGPKKWPEERQVFLEVSRNSQISWNMAGYQLAREFSATVALLKAGDLRRFFGFEKKQRAYFCPECSLADRDAPVKCKTAQLKPNTPESTEIYCFVCRKTSQIERRACDSSECKGNVICPDWDYCLTCHDFS